MTHLDGAQPKRTPPPGPGTTDDKRREMERRSISRRSAMPRSLVVRHASRRSPAERTEHQCTSDGRVGWSAEIACARLLSMKLCVLTLLATAPIAALQLRTPPHAVRSAPQAQQPAMARCTRRAVLGAVITFGVVRVASGERAHSTAPSARVPTPTLTS